MNLDASPKAWAVASRAPTPYGSLQNPTSPWNAVKTSPTASLYARCDLKNKSKIELVLQLAGTASTTPARWPHPPPK
eukprot:CCRYP_013374-RD/>CCRYP_013374-RD protein AED:0.40 eAED:0.40 QI:0/-1/0/1/-1/0/1/0/76